MKTSPKVFPLLLLLLLVVASTCAQQRRQSQQSQQSPNNAEGRRRVRAPSPYTLYGPHGYRTYPHSRCQEVPTVDVNMADIEGDWNLVEHLTSFNGKPFPPNNPYTCPEARVVFSPRNKRMNVSQVSVEPPFVFRDVVEWVQHPEKSGVFFHEENIFSLWTMKFMEVDPDDHVLFFFCIDYTLWPGWNHRGVFILSRNSQPEKRIRRRLSEEAHRRMRIDYHGYVDPTSCDPDELLSDSLERWHPHRRVNRKSYRAPIDPFVSRGHRRNLDVLD